MAKDNVLDLLLTNLYRLSKEQLKLMAWIQIVLIQVLEQILQEQLQPQLHQLQQLQEQLELNQQPAELLPLLV